MGDLDADQADQVVEIATRLFAELGFDGTSMRLIADATGVDMEALVQRFGDKTGLYREVMGRAHETERKVLEAALASATPDLQGLLTLADVYLDFHADHPQIPALWMQRWMGDAADVPDLEDLYVHALSIAVVDAVRDLTPPDVDTEHLIWSIVWCVYGFLSGGVQHPGHSRRNPRGEPPDRQALARFRSYLHAMVIHMTAPVGEGAR